MQGAQVRGSRRIARLNQSPCQANNTAYVTVIKQIKNIAVPLPVMVHLLVSSLLIMPAGPNDEAALSAPSPHPSDPGHCTITILTLLPSLPLHWLYCEVGAEEGGSSATAGAPETSDTWGHIGVIPRGDPRRSLGSVAVNGLFVSASSAPFLYIASNTGPTTAQYSPEQE